MRATAFAALAATSVAAFAAANPSPAGHGSPPPAAAPDEPDGLLLLAVLDPERALLADPRTGATTGRELPGGTLCHGPLIAAGGRVVYVGSRHGRFTALSAPLGRPGRARSLGRADVMTASATPGSLWLGRSRGHALALRELDAGGRMTGRARLRSSGWLHGAVGDGLVVERDQRIVLERPGRPALTLGAGWPLAAGSGHVAWCRGGCRRVQVWSDSGTRKLAPPAGIRPDAAGEPSFSPDGARLALPVTTPRGARIAVIDLERGAWSIVRGSHTGGYEATAWSPSGRWLYFSGRGNGVRAWRGGAGRAVRLPIRTGGTVLSISAGVFEDDS